MKKGLIVASGIVGTIFNGLSLIMLPFIYFIMSAIEYELYNDYDMYSNYVYYSEFREFMVLFIIISVVVCLIGLIGSIRLIVISNKKDMVNHKSEVLVWAIIFIFTNLISSILAFVGYGTSDKPKIVANEDGEEKGELEIKLNELKKLKDEGLITKEEFEKKKKKVLDI